ncbi:MAG TPA: bifunctional diguanylate cyclase/phosphodiesterase [Clostridiales bacterium]|nr:bifunctional diguanylate cyclase/phosphodiesterase [Clostridiales bacterium]
MPNKNSLLKFFKENHKTSIHDISLLYIDIDNFRYINQTEGHEFGSQVLLEVSKRLALLAKPNGRVYHLSGDEFVIIYNNPSETGLGEVMAAYIQAGFKKSFDISDKELYINISIGVVERPAENMTIQQMLEAAEVAMYRAKETGKNKYALYDITMSRTLAERTSIIKHMRHAIEQNEFEIHYQPQLDLFFDRIDGFEALLRWNSKELGWVAPDQFIKAAEATQLIVPLGAWVIRNACAFLKKLDDMGYSPLNMSVNVSIIQLMQDDFVPTVQDTLEFLELSPENLELEITESLLMESFDLVMPKLEELRKIGVRIALDDFGTGYSSLSYLSQIPITTLKLDKSFINKIGTKEEGLIESILHMCKRLNLCTVAEGVEKNSQIPILKEMGCHKIQGYLFSKPLTEEGIINLLQTAPTLVDDIYLLDSQNKQRK